MKQLNGGIMDASDLSIVVFSKNRPMQLYALLESLVKYTDAKEDCISVIYKYDIEYQNALFDVMSDFNKVSYHMEYDFKNQVCNILKNNKKYTMFLMDDQVIKENINLIDAISFIEKNNLFCFSLRLGENTTYCYPTKQDQNIPKSLKKINDFIIWNFKDGLYDWNYPLSLDGHIFETQNWMQMLQKINFTNPNTLEANLQVFSNSIPTTCGAFRTSKTINLPINKVQDVFDNRHGNISEKYLLDLFQNGKKISVKDLFQIKTNAAHQELEINFIDR